MNNIVYFDTASGSQNMGDYIIMDSFEKEMFELSNNNFVVRYATHTPICHFYQQFKKNPIIKYSCSAKYKFIAGTNLIQYNMVRPWSNLNINILNCMPYKNSILVGCGSSLNSRTMNLYTKLLFKKILSKNYIHSVRDERTKKTIESLGFKVINTGCPTLWSFTNEFCNSIRKTKCESVIFTITDYNKDIEKDRIMIEILKNNYKNVYFWIQGSNDYDYIKNLTDVDKIKIIPPDFKIYKSVLEDDEIDYVGTRLHAGIFALQHKQRAIIIGIDNRVRDMVNTYNLNAIDRENIFRLEEYINKEICTDIKIDLNIINDWKKQFN